MTGNCRDENGNKIHFSLILCLFLKIKIPSLLKLVPFCCTVEWIWSISNGRCGVSGTLNGAFLDYRPRPVKVIFELHMQMKSFQDFFFLI